MFSPTALVRGNPARAKFAAENWVTFLTQLRSQYSIPTQWNTQMSWVLSWVGVELSTRPLMMLGIRASAGMYWPSLSRIFCATLLMERFNSLPLDDGGCNLKEVIFTLLRRLRNCPHVTITKPRWWLGSIDSGNSLVSSGNKPLSEPMMTQISVTIWRHQTSMS